MRQRRVTPRQRICLFSPDEGRAQLLCFRELPPWMQDNYFIETHYRPPALTALECVRVSFFQMTNESVNVWTHFVASVFFLVLCVLLGWSSGTLHNGVPYYARHMAAISDDVLNALRGLAHGTLPLLLSASLCTGLSTAYHTFWPMSARAQKVFVQMDFVGIACLCAGHAFTAVFYAFYCAPHLANRYFAAIGAALMLSLRVILSAKFRAKTSRLLRAFTFSALGACIALPVFHAGLLHGWNRDSYLLFLGWLLGAGFFYLLGATFYASRLPECCRPGKHDRYAASHQLMHVSVIIGACLHAYGCHRMIPYRLENACTLSPLVLQ